MNQRLFKRGVWVMKRILMKLKRINLTKKIYKKVFIIIGKLPKKDKTIVFESFLGKQYSCNPRAIYEHMQKEHPEFDCYWSIDPRYKSQFEGLNLKLSNRFSIKWLLLMGRTKYWVSNSRLPLWIPKPKNTTYLQTWHGTPLKKLGIDIDEIHMPGTNTNKYKRNFLSESYRWNYLISPNRFSTNIFQRAFCPGGETIETGYPRNDFLFNYTLSDKQSVRKKLDLPDGKKVILYAPTWRDNEYHEVGKYKFNLKMDLDQMRVQLGDEYVIVLRLHYLIADKLDLQEYNEFVYDGSNYSDIRELYIISDILITDYSSVFFDYANLKRPIIFYAYDIDMYRDNLRGFYFDYEKGIPGPITKTTKGLIQAIKCFADGKLTEEYSERMQRFTHLEDGNASKKIVDRVFFNKESE